MLSIYLHENINKLMHSNSNNVQWFNDAFFSLNIENTKINKDIESIIRKIDSVEYTGNHRIKSKFQKDIYLRMDELSTGCKTAINTFVCPDKIFYAGECGENALRVICNFNKGNILVSHMFIPLEFNNNIQVITGNNLKKIISNNIELEDTLANFFC